MQTDSGVVQCPECSLRIRVDPGYVTWCDQCGWNVDPGPADRPLPAWRTKLEHRLADTLYRELEQGAVHRPGWDLARVTALVLSALLLVLPVTGLLAGVGLIVFYRPFWLSIPLALIAFAIAAAFRPRAQYLPPDSPLVLRDEAPGLFALLDEIAAALGTQRIAAVAVDTEPNVWFARIGWRFRPVVGIGLPLWVTLGPQERVAVLAHELGHGKNGDARHGWVTEAARSILDQLHRAFSNQEYDEYRLDVAYAVGADTTQGHLTRVINSILGPLVRGYTWLLDRTDLRSGQRAEYLADRKSGEVAGSEAAAAALERSLLADAAYRALERALRFEQDVPPLEAVRRSVSGVPRREIERRLRVSELRETRTDATHPPTNLRTKLIRTRPSTSARVVLGIDANRVIDRELAPAADAALKELRAELPR
ncbi:M48 family metalloprotease [Kribbella amoyensis]|uniref:M48 family metalloprotease n=1 Tax=Kribbella amoyensis TaxID=996641 RepID=UPI0011A9D55B|nr:M48 family metallopeptidase [Kribbella amoyensis]